MSVPAPRLERDLDDVRRRWVPDRRLGVFDVEIAGARLAGCVSSRDALQALRRLAADAGLGEDVRLLPDASVGGDTAAVVTAALAPLLGQPTLRSPCWSGAATGCAFAPATATTAGCTPGTWRWARPTGPRTGRSGPALARSARRSRFPKAGCACRWARAWRLAPAAAWKRRTAGTARWS